MTLSPGMTLGPYEILSPLGVGGMGEVYRARDRRLLRDVALKVVSEAIALSESAGVRFEREARTVAALSHPNVVSIFDVGEERGTRYLVMELLEGETLRERLDRGPLPHALAVDIALQVSRGLQAAHGKGVVHRDLKPANLLLTRDGLVKILDFGLAHQVQDRPEDPTTARTLSKTSEPGQLLGTVAYMSPEQARGQSADARSDIFALGAILCEMIAGEPAFGAPSLAESLSAILRDEPRGLGRVRHEAPQALVQVLNRCLEKSPGERFQSSKDLTLALENVLSGTAPRVDAPKEAEGPSIAVLPFANMSPDPDTEYFSDGITEEIINTLAHLPGLRVAARTSCFAFKGKNQDLRGIAETLRVSSILEGSVRRAGNTLRITAQLIDAHGGHHIWSERYDREITDVFAIQDEIAHAIAAQLEVTLADPEGPRPGVARQNAEAFDLYLRGRHFFNRRAAPEAIREFEAAIALDPMFAPAYTGLSDSYGIHAFYGGIDTRVAYSRARRAAERARELAPKSAEINVSMGILEHYFGWDFDREERELDEALRRRPKVAAPHYWLSLCFGLRGRLEESLPFARQAGRLEPLSPYAVSVAGWAFLTADKPLEARAEFLKGLEFDPNSLLQLAGLFRSESALGHHADAVNVAEKLATITGSGSSFGLGMLAHAYAAAKRPLDAAQVLSRLSERATRHYVAPNHLAPALVVLGELDAAFEAAERACAERNALAWWGILYDPAWEALRADRRFSSLADRARVAA
jgi:serine/threonine-protein kinase